MDIGAQLRRWREGIGLSLKDAAEAAGGYSVDQILHLEQFDASRSHLHLVLAIKLCRLYRMPEERLFSLLLEYSDHIQREGEPQKLYEEGMVFIRDGSFPEGLECLLAALNNNPDSAVRINARYNIALTYQRLGALRSAEYQAFNALEAAHKAGESSAVNKCRLMLFGIFLDRGRIGSAEAMSMTCEEVGKTIRIAEIKAEKARLNYFKGDIGLARQLSMSAADLFKSGGYRDRYLVASCSSGYYEYLDGNEAGGMNIMEKALRELESGSFDIDNSRLIPCKNLYLRCLAQIDYDTADQEAQGVIKICEQRGMWDDLLFILISLHESIPKGGEKEKELKQRIEALLGLSQIHFPEKQKYLEEKK